MLMRSIVLGTAVVAAGSTAGCASIRPTAQAVVPGTDTRAEVLARMGGSPFIWFDRDGQEHWDYSRNPFSSFGYRASFDDTGTVVAWRELRQREDVRRLEVGKSTVEDVRRVLGQPQRLFYIRGDAHWQWQVARGSGPFRLVAQIAPDGTLKGLGEYPLDRGPGGMMR
jgi:hypothetical protein